HPRYEDAPASSCCSARVRSSRTTARRRRSTPSARAAASARFDAATSRNGSFGEAHYYKALAYLTGTPADYDRAVAAARAARNNGFPNAEQLLREAEERARGDEEVRG